MSASLKSGPRSQSMSSRCPRCRYWGKPACPSGNVFKVEGPDLGLVVGRRKHVPFLSDSFTNLCRSKLDAQTKESRDGALAPSRFGAFGALGGRVERCRLDTRRPDLKVGAVAETYSWQRVSVALIGADQVHPSAERSRLSQKSPPACVGGISVAQATGTCRQAQSFAFLTACLEPGCAWGLTFSVVPFVTWSALSS